MNALELRVPPVLLVLIAGAFMWLAAALFPGFAVSIPWRVILAAGCAATGAGIALAGVLAFRHAHTTVNPTTPEASSSVVTSGIYRRTRNPMYLGFLLLLGAWGVYLASMAAMLLLPLFVLYMNRFQIAPEERALAAKFGTQYGAYMHEVRRWL
jgi:protein-S-isoprenylcysteine O-methyltransferase Ste14